MSGQDWVQQSPHPTHIHLYAIDFVDVNTGWVAGGNAAEGGIYRTLDGGATWEVQLFSEFGGDEFEDLHMLDASVGWVSGTGFQDDDYGATLHHTTNGGDTWTQVTIPRGPTGNDVTTTRVWFADASTGWISTRPSGAVSHLYRTTNGGTSWTDLGSVALDSWRFIDTQTGWAANTDHEVMRSTNGGTTWTVTPTQPNPGALETTVSAAFSATEAIVTTFEAWPVGFTVHHTTDGGASWETIQSGAGTRWQFYHDAMTGWGVSDGIQKTTDGGMTWVEQRPQNEVPETFRDGDVIDAQTAYLVGDYGYMIRTHDGGATWEQVSNGSGRPMYNVGFADKRHGWATGDGDTILRTTDGGVTWTHQHTRQLMFSNPREVRALDPLTALVFYGDESPVGEAGVLYTVDGGDTWRNLQGTNFWPSGPVHFPDLERGFKINRFGHYFSKTIDGGDTWESNTTGIGPFPANNAILDIFFLDDRYGWMVGYFNKAFRTTDGGLTWTPMLDVPGQVFRQVRFSDPIHGWVVGNNGFVARTENGGLSWEIQTQPGTFGHHIQDMVMVGPNEMYFCTMGEALNAYVRHTTDGGQTWTYALYGEFKGVANGLAEVDGDLWCVGTDGNIFARRDTCVADVTGDGILDVFDVLAFLEAFEASDPAADLAAPTGTFDVFDVLMFLSLFDAGC
ncbi:MAG: hypothetical protein KDA28_13780 [Phycisphaerales bacterium]|nr:hypothetical protein [Phycisphaerales bacterium]